MNWLDRARRQIRDCARRPAAVTAEGNPTAVTAVLHPAPRQKMNESIADDGSSTRFQEQEAEFILEEFEERAAIMEFDGGLSQEEAERAAWAQISKRNRLH